jgi:hypothetical protein
VPPNLHSPKKSIHTTAKKAVKTLNMHRLMYSVFYSTTIHLIFERLTRIRSDSFERLASGPARLRAPSPISTPAFPSPPR